MRKILMFAFVLVFLAVVAWADESDKDLNRKRADDSDTPSYTGSSGNSGGMLLGGGPDAFGYMWKDSNDPGGPTFNWVDISAIGTEISPWPHGTVDDGYTDLIPMGITFNYYGIDYTSVVVSTNGWVSFLTQTNAYLGNVAIPSIANPNALLAVDWDDLDGGSVGHCYYYYDSAENQFIVSWVNWPYFPDPTDPHDFQVIIDSDDSSVVFQYGAGAFSQTDISVGIENETGTIGLQLAYNTAYPTNSLATRFWRPPLLAHDTGVNAILSPGPNTYKDSTYSVSCRVRNFGSNSESNVPVRFLIADSTGATVYNNLHTIPSIPSQVESVVTYPDWTVNEANLHRMTAYTNLAGDLDRTNDTLHANTFTQTHRGNGGPVEYWSFADNITGGGRPFDWIDISSVGDSIHFSSPDDGNSGFIPMGMSFFYLGTFYNQIAVCTNGWLSFTDGTSTVYNNTTIPNASAPNGMVALLWDDMHIRTAGKVWHYYDSVENQFIVQYDSLEFYDSTGHDLGMEIIFDGDDNSIKMQYGFFVLGCETDITIGIENETGTIGLAYDNSGEVLQTPYAGVAITWTYVPPGHDVAVSGITQPSGLIYGGQTYNVVATVFNNGSNQESFTVTATDNHGYNNTQNVTALDPLAQVDVTFPNWTPTFACSTYVVTVTSNLGGDMDPSNNSSSRNYIVIPVSNFAVQYDDGIPSNAWRFYSPSNYIANQFEAPYLGATLQAVAFKFTNQDDFPTWPDSFSQDVRVMIFTDEDLDGFPDAAPVYEDTLTPPRTGVTVWPIGCQTTLTLNCEKFWAAWTTVDSLGPEGIVIDALTDHPDMKWAYLTGVWQLYDPYAGDNMIRAYINGDLNQSADINVASTSVVGSAQPGAADTVGNAIDNAAGECELSYSVEVSQDIFRQASFRPQPRSADFSGMTEVANPDAFSTANNTAPIKVVTVTNEKGIYTEPLYPLVILSQGGPDAFGYIWIDSDEPGGPAYNWVDITTLGDSITWDTCSSTFGCEDEGISVPMPLGFTFNYYGVSYTEVTASSNGFISFLPLNTWYTTNASIPSGTDPNAIISVMWDDLDGLAGPLPGTIYYYHDVTLSRFIISWVNWGFWLGTNNFSMQVILDANDNSIKTQYNGIFDQTDYTVGIENHDGTDGLQVAYNAAYVHDQLALLFYAPTLWLSTDLVDGVLPAGAPPQDFDIFMDAAELDPGTYTGAINIISNDPDEAVTTIDVLFVVGGGPGCQYIPGDINNNGDVNGVDVGYGVNYFKGFGPPPPVDCGTPVGPCPEASPFYAAGDVNANCTFNGVDITYFVNYLKGIGPPLSFCADCPPAALAAPGQVTPSLQPSKARVIQSQQ